MSSHTITALKQRRAQRTTPEILTPVDLVTLVRGCDATTTRDSFQHPIVPNLVAMPFDALHSRTGFLVDDVYKFCDGLTDAGVEFKKKPDDGSMKGLAFAIDPDGYWVEIVKRGAIV